MMRHVRMCIGFASAVAVLSACADGDGWAALNAAARQKTLRQIRPGEPGVRPFWNANAKVFMHVPSFDFRETAGKAEYAFSLRRTNGTEVATWTARKPWAPIPARIWADLPCDYYTVSCAGAGERTFYRAAAFRGPYPASKGDYRAAARRCYKAVTALPYVRSWLEKPEPSPDYDLNCYPSKILGSVIEVLSRDGSADSVKIARRMADWLIAQSEGPDAPLAHFPPTYWGTARPEPKKFAGCVMLHYPARVANAFLDLAAATGERRYREQAVAIARTYLKLQGEDGSWPLMMRAKDGSEYRPNRLNPSRWVLEMLERVGKVTGETAFADAVTRAVGFYEKGPLVTWNWEAQFEDQDPPPPYGNLTKQFAMECACRFYAQGRIAEAEELKDWCEDQFTVWGPPLHIFNWKTWRIPCALEQYNCYMPIDASLADMIHLFLAAYRATGSNLDYEKAKALADGVLRYQRKDGTIPTYFFENRWENGQSASDWVNCMAYTSTVLEEFAPLAEAKAELERFVGADEAARVRIVQTDVASPRDEDFRITAKGGKITLTGGRRGILWGVYELLEKYAGVEFLAPDHTHVPAGAKLTVPDGTDDFQAPAFETRDQYWFPMMYNPEYARHLRFNRDTQPTWSTRLWKCHTFFKLVPPETYAKDHPEYYSEIDGKRIGMPSETNRGQLCTTNPDVIEIAASNTLEVMRSEPWAKYFAVSQMDWQYFCQCAKCRAVKEAEGGVEAGPYAVFLNEVADRVRDEFPDNQITMNAYFGNSAPPKTKLRPNAGTFYAEVTHDVSRSLGKGPYGRNHEVADELRGWAKLTDQIHVWDYTTTFALYPVPLPNVRTFADNLRLFRDSHVRHMFLQGAWQGNLASFAMLKTWVLAHLEWNPDQDSEALVRRFIRAYYGKAAPFVQKYYELIEDQPALHPEIQLVGNMTDECNPYLTHEILKRSDELLRQAAAAVKDDPVLLGHVHDEIFGVTFTRLARMARPLNVSSEYADMVASGKLRAKVGALKKMMERRHPVQISESSDLGAKYWAKMTNLAEVVSASVTNGCACTEESSFKTCGMGRWIDSVEDRTASGGKAYKLFGTHSDWCVQHLVSEFLCWDAGAKCRLRLRLRAEILPDADPGDPVVAFGINDKPNGKMVVLKLLTVGDFRKSGEYAWFEALDWSPALTQTFWMAPGGVGKGGKRSFSNVYFDKAEVKVVGDAVK